jgi:hypothetical protein
MYKVKQSLDRPGQALRVPGSWGSQISRQSAHESDKVVRPTHRPPLPPQEILLLLISVRGWVDPRDIVSPEGLCQWKILMTPSGVEPATFQLVTQSVNQRQHRVPLIFTRVSSVWRNFSRRNICLFPFNATCPAVKCSGKEVLPSACWPH